MHNSFISRHLLTILLVSFVVISAIPVSADAPDITQDVTIQDDGVLKGEGFTHSVLLELFVTTWCDRCPSSEEASTELTMEYGENFHYISMVCDEVDEADQRSEDYAVETYPTAIFDGGDEDDRASENDSSSETDKERYEDHIEACGNRDVSATPVTLSVDVTDQGGGRVDVSYSATFTGNSQWFDCHIRVYVTERSSRFPNIHDEPIPYGFLGYAFDEDLRLFPQVEQADQTTYDTDGGEFDNIVVIAGIFDKRTGIERYVVQTASTEEYGDVMFSDIEHEPETPAHNEKVMIYCTAVGNFETIYVEVAACTNGSCLVPEDVDMELVEGNYYQADIGKFDDEIESVHYKIVAEDSAGEKSRSATYEFEFDDSGSDDEEDSINILMYGGGSVVVLVIILGALFVMKKKPEDDSMDPLQNSTIPAAPEEVKEPSDKDVW